ncbi:hypothetical protein C8R43DRAFT_881966, partial [Mycena crocata]
VDANGILNISASDKTTGGSNRITITNDNGRLSKEEIEGIVNEIEQHEGRRCPHNDLEPYTYNHRNSISDEQLADKVKLEGAVNDTIEWLDTLQQGLQR